MTTKSTERPINREEWLTTAAGKVIRNVLAPAGYELDDQKRPLSGAIKVTCGWPSRGGVSRKQQRIGECWGFESSAGGVHELFISPVLVNPVRVLDVLAHELLHAHFPRGTKHNRTFASACRAIGLEGKATATVAGKDLAGVLGDIATDLGPYPHSELRAVGPEKKQGTRDRKAFCDHPDCPSAREEKGPFKVRLTKIWMLRYATEFEDQGEDPDRDPELPTRISLCCPDCGSQMAVE